MEAVSYTFLRQNLKKVLARIADTSDTFIITRRNGKNMIMLSQEDYDSLEETAYLMRSPANLKMLQESLKDIEEGNTIPFALFESV